MLFEIGSRTEEQKKDPACSPWECGTDTRGRDFLYNITQELHHSMVLGVTSELCILGEIHGSVGRVVVPNTLGSSPALTTYLL